MDWYPKNVEAYRLDTRHLSIIEHGAYNLLIDEYMITRQPLPDNDRALASISKASAEQWADIAMTIRAFFKAKDGYLIHKRCEQELDAQDKVAKRQSEKAQKAARIRWAIAKGLDATSMLRECSENAQPMLGDATSTVDINRDKDTADALGRIPEIRTQVLKIMDEAGAGTWIGDASRVAAWLGSGADPDLDIYPTMRALLGRRNGQGPPRSLKYFDQAIADAHRARITPMPEGNPNAQGQQAGPDRREKLVAAVAARLDERDRQDLERRAGGDAAAVLPAVSSGNG